MTNPIYKNLRFWHVSCFCVDVKDELSLHPYLLKLLLCNALKHIFENQASIVLAECGFRLGKILKIIGADVSMLAKPSMYLGSEIVRVMSTSERLKDFMEQNRNLLFFFKQYKE